MSPDLPTGTLVQVVWIDNMAPDGFLKSQDSTRQTLGWIAQDSDPHLFLARYMDLPSRTLRDVFPIRKSAILLVKEIYLEGPVLFQYLLPEEITNDQP